MDLSYARPAASRSWRRGFRTAQVYAMLCGVGLLLCGAALDKAITLDFERLDIGSVPADFAIALTGSGSPGLWRITPDSTAPSGGKVLAQTSTDTTDARYPLCIYEPFTATDVTLSVRFKAVAGTVDQAAGLVVRYRDPAHYYIVRANALEHNVRLYKVERGDRQQLAGAHVTVPAGQWQRLTLAVQGSHFRVLFNDVLLFEADDATMPGAGKVGLWTKADSVTYFDDLTMVSSDAR